MRREQLERDLETSLQSKSEFDLRIRQVHLTYEQQIKRLEEHFRDQEKENIQAIHKLELQFSKDSNKQEVRMRLQKIEKQFEQANQEVIKLREENKNL